jgi:hypothetical protein
MNSLLDTSSKLSKDDLSNILKSYEKRIQELRQKLENSENLTFEKDLNDETILDENNGNVEGKSKLENVKFIKLPNNMEESNKEMIQISTSSFNNEDALNEVQLNTINIYLHFNANLIHISTGTH